MTEIDPDADSPPTPDDSHRSASEDSTSADAPELPDPSTPETDEDEPVAQERDIWDPDFGGAADDGWELLDEDDLATDPLNFALDDELAVPDERASIAGTEVAGDIAPVVGAKVADDQESEETAPGVETVSVDETEPVVEAGSVDESLLEPDRDTKAEPDASPNPAATSSVVASADADDVTGEEPSRSGPGRRRTIAPLLMGLVVVIGFGWLLSKCGGDEADPAVEVIVTVLPPDLSKATVLDRSVLIDARAAVAGSGYESVIVSADDGTIVLEGAVRSDEDVATAEQAARSVVGVDQVDNRLILEAVDDDVESTVLQALLRDGYDRVQIAVVGGDATLTGSVDSEADLAAVEAIVSGVDGVTAVASSVIVAAASAGATPEAIALLADLESLFAASPILFEPAEAIITEESKTTLDEAAALIGASNLVLEVGGHTDSSGDERTNQLLSEMRAQAVKGYLIAKGVEPDRLDAVGYGQSDPIADNSTEEGRTSTLR